MVSNYDDVTEGRFCEPSITTIRASRCVRWERRPLIFWNGFGMEKRFPVSTYLPEEIVFRQSCGCGANGGDEGGQYATKLSTELDKVLYLETAALAMVTMLANAKDLEEFTQCLQKYVLRETGFKSFTLCLADHWEQQLPLPGMSYGKSMYGGDNCSWESINPVFWSHRDSRRVS